VQLITDAECIFVSSNCKRLPLFYVLINYAAAVDSQGQCYQIIRPIAPARNLKVEPWLFTPVA